MFTEARAGIDRRRQPVEQRLVERRVRRRRTERDGDRPPRPAGAADGGITRPVGGDRSARSRTCRGRAVRTRVGHGVDRRRNPPPERRPRRLGARRSGSSCTATVGRKQLVNRAHDTQIALDVAPEGFTGTLRAYQAEALAWIDFLAANELGGCLALDMGLGKTPTVLAHLARTAGRGPSLVIAPAAVVGNWAAEAARFAPDLRVLVHHGAARAADTQLEKEIADADVIITTYATAVRDVDALADAEWTTMVLDEAQAIKNPASETAQALRRIPARTRLALTGTPIENGVGDLWAILDFTNPGLVGPRAQFVAQLGSDAETGLRALNGLLLFRRTKSEPEVAAELPDKIDELDHCTMTTEQIGLYQAVLDDLLAKAADPLAPTSKGAVLAAITALKQICNHPAAYLADDQPLTGRSGKLTRLEEIVESVFASGERVLIFTHFATWGRRLAAHLSEITGVSDRLLRRRPHPVGPRPDGDRVPERSGRRARWCSP